MSDVSKRLEKADKYLQRGRLHDALDEYLAALDQQPGNHAIRQAAAELCLTLNFGEDAARLFSDLLDAQLAASDTASLATTYRKLTRVGRPNVDQMLRYAQLMERGNPREALEVYHSVAAEYRTAGRVSDLPEVLRRISVMEPSAENFAAEGDVAAQLNDDKTAAIAYVQAGIMVEKAGGNAAQWYERAYIRDAGNPGAAFGHGYALLCSGDYHKAMQVLEPLANYASSPVEARDAYAKALLGAGRLEEAEPVLWKLYEADVRRLDSVVNLLREFLKAEKGDAALALARKLDDQMTRAGKRREFVLVMQDIVERQSPPIQFLYYMVDVFNTSNREHDYCAMLTRLFDLHYAAGDFLRAGDCLDRAAEVDPYEAGHQRRFEMLRGKIENGRFNAIGNRFSSVMRVEAAGDDSDTAVPEPEPESEPTVLEDLMLQAEIFLQYSMRSKAVERLERILRLFPHEEDRNDKLHELYNNAGFFPRYNDPPQATPQRQAQPEAPAPPRVVNLEEAQRPSSAASTSRVVDSPSGAAPVTRAMAAESSVDNISRVTEITRNIYRQGNVKAVLFASVNDVGRHWNASRCIAGLCSPTKPPSAALEYCAPGVPQSDVMAIVKLIATLQPLAVSMGVVAISNARSAHELSSIRDVIDTLGIESILAVPLADGDEQEGILILEQCTPRIWGQTDVVVLRTIADQMVLAVHNAKLRSLVKNLAVTEERSGLLKRASYIDVLLSEVRRAIQANAPVTLMLAEFGKASAMVRDIGEAAVDALVQQIGQTVQAHIRQNDVAVRYDLTQIAVVLSDTSDKNAFFVGDKLRRVLGNTRLPGKESSVPITIGIAEAVMNPHYEPVDIVTELINRVESALDAARAAGGNKSHALAPAWVTAAAGD